jgi:hypothetical protein
MREAVELYLGGLPVWTDQFSNILDVMDWRA